MVKDRDVERKKEKKKKKRLQVRGARRRYDKISQKWLDFTIKKYQLSLSVVKFFICECQNHVCR